MIISDDPRLPALDKILAANRHSEFTPVVDPNAPQFVSLPLSSSLRERFGDSGFIALKLHDDGSWELTRDRTTKSIHKTVSHRGAMDVNASDKSSCKDLMVLRGVFSLEEGKLILWDAT